MNKHPFLLKPFTVFIPGWALFLCVAQVLAQDQPPRIDFEKQVLPILNQYCAGCHNGTDREGGLSLTSLAEIQAGGENGTVIAAGESGRSGLIRVLTGQGDTEMPPEGSPQPTPADVALLQKWIDQGALGPMSVSGLRVPALPPVKQQQRSITSADWSADGRWIAVGRFQSVELIDPADPARTRQLTGFSGKINSVRFTRDSNQLVVASGIAGLRGEASVWNVETGERDRLVQGHSDTVYSAVLSPDGQTLATAGYDRKIMLWDAAGKPQRTIGGHNGAVYDLDFSADSKTLVSASGDQTLKVWSVATGQRLDTLGQPLKEQFAGRFSPDNGLIVGGGRDNRIRVWKFIASDRPTVNPILFSRFAHEKPIVGLSFSPDGSALVSSSEDRTIKVWETQSFTQIGAFKNQPDVCSAVAMAPGGKRLFVGRLDGSSQFYDLPGSGIDDRLAQPASPVVEAAGLSKPPEFNSMNESEPNDSASQANTIELPARISGIVNSPNRTDSDLFRFRAEQGQSLVFEINAARQKSPLDSHLQILDLEGRPVPRVLLRAVRDSYFTFRGKDSNTSDDFRLHNWQEMKLNEYLYAGGEVVKLFQHPRGPDSGFIVYPGSGRRHAFFDTTPLAHALHEPCYIVQPFPIGTQFVPNGLPVFTLNYENDDGAQRNTGSDSRLFFVAPRTADYLVRVADVRDFQGPGFKYELTARRTSPGFKVSLSVDANIQVGSGKEFSVNLERLDGFAGAVRVDIQDVPDGLFVTSPLVVEAGHQRALGVIYALPGAEKLQAEDLQRIRISATSMEVDSRQSRTQDLKNFGELKIVAEREIPANRKSDDAAADAERAANPNLRIRIAKPGMDLEAALEQAVTQPLQITIRPGETVEAKVVVRRYDHQGRISFGNADSGRNLAHGVYIDDIGLNGLMITQGNVEQRFFITAESWVQPQTRFFHIRANDVGRLTSQPVLVRVVGSPEAARN